MLLPFLVPRPVHFHVLGTNSIREASCILRRLPNHQTTFLPLCCLRNSDHLRLLHCVPSRCCCQCLNKPSARSSGLRIYLSLPSVLCWTQSPSEPSRPRIPLYLFLVIYIRPDRNLDCTVACDPDLQYTSICPTHTIKFPRPVQIHSSTRTTGLISYSSSHTVSLSREHRGEEGHSMVDRSCLLAEPIHPTMLSI
jgi:hypothetical protein